MSQDEAAMVTIQDVTLLKEPFTFVRSGKKTDVYYRHVFCGEVVDGDLQTLAHVIDVVTDKVHNRAVGRAIDIAGAAAGFGVAIGASLVAPVRRPKPWYKKLF